MSGNTMERDDPITLEIIRHELLSIPNQIEKNIERTAFSPLVQEYKDYAVGLVDPGGALVCQSRGSLPIFVANALGTAVRADSPWRSFQEMMAAARAEKGKYSYSTSGIATTNHLAMEDLLEREGAEMLHIPYRGSQ